MKKNKLLNSFIDITYDGNLDLMSSFDIDNKQTNLLFIKTVCPGLILNYGRRIGKHNKRYFVL